MTWLNRLMSEWYPYPEVLDMITNFTKNEKQLLARIIKACGTSNTTTRKPASFALEMELSQYIIDKAFRKFRKYNILQEIGGVIPRYRMIDINKWVLQNIQMILSEANIKPIEPIQYSLESEQQEKEQQEKEQQEKSVKRKKIKYNNKKKKNPLFLSSTTKLRLLVKQRSAADATKRCIAPEKKITRLVRRDLNNCPTFNFVSSKVQKLRRLPIDYTPVVENPGIRISTNILRMIKIWNSLADKKLPVTRINLNNQKTKVFVSTLKACQSFFGGSIVQRAVMPEKLFRLDRRKYNIQDFQVFIDRFTLQIEDRDYRNYFLSTNRHSLHDFLLGNRFSELQSILFHYCYLEPQPKIKLINPEEVALFTESWKELTNETKIRVWQSKEFDKYISWALPHFTQLRNGFSTLKSNFVDPTQVMYFFTFGALRQLRDRKKRFSAGILNQSFFHGIMEELRIFHSYTV